MSSKSSTNGSKEDFERLEKWVNGSLKFWNRNRIQDPTHKDYRGPSEDLPLSPRCWTYNIPEYEKRLSEEVKHHRKFIKL